jgi:hypothetical protein
MDNLICRGYTHHFASSHWMRAVVTQPNPVCLPTSRLDKILRRAKAGEYEPRKWVNENYGSQHSGPRLVPAVTTHSNIPSASLSPNFVLREPRFLHQRVLHPSVAVPLSTFPTFSPPMCVTEVVIGRATHPCARGRWCGTCRLYQFVKENFPDTKLPKGTTALFP